MKKAVHWGVGAGVLLFVLIGSGTAMAGEGQGGTLDCIKTKSVQVWRKAKKIFSNGQRYCQRLTDKYLKKYLTPLDRSNADAKGNSLAKAMDEASQASAALSKKNLAINSEVKRQASVWDSEDKKEEKRGRFSSLD